MVRKNRHTALGLLLTLSLPVIGFMLYQHFHAVDTVSVTDVSPVLIFNEKTPLRVRVADDAVELKRGLSGTQTLAPTEGMLFIFPEDGYHGIWMKDMVYPLDVVWISGGGVVVDIKENIRPDTYPKVFEPSVPARFVVEVNAHYVDSFNIAVGDTVKIPEYVLPPDLQKK